MDVKDYRAIEVALSLTPFILYMVGVFSYEAAVLISLASIYNIVRLTGYNSVK